MTKGTQDAGDPTKITETTAEKPADDRASFPRTGNAEAEQVAAPYSPEEARPDGETAAIVHASDPATFIKRPVAIEALVWTGENKSQMIEFAGACAVFTAGQPVEGRPSLVIETLEGSHIASIGDYIIKGIQGEFYPCKPDIFADSYLPLGDVEQVKRPKHERDDGFTLLGMNINIDLASTTAAMDVPGGAVVRVTEHLFDPEYSDGSPIKTALAVCFVPGVNVVKNGETGTLVQA